MATPKQEITDGLVQVLLDNQRDTQRALTELAELMDSAEVPHLSGTQVAGVVKKTLLGIAESDKRVMRSAEHLTAELEKLR